MKDFLTTLDFSPSYIWPNYLLRECLWLAGHVDMSTLWFISCVMTWSLIEIIFEVCGDEEGSSSSAKRVSLEKGEGGAGANVSRTRRFQFRILNNLNSRGIIIRIFYCLSYHFIDRIKYLGQETSKMIVFNRRSRLRRPIKLLEIRSSTLTLSEFRRSRVSNLAVLFVNIAAWLQTFSELAPKSRGVNVYRPWLRQKRWLGACVVFQSLTRVLQA